MIWTISPKSKRDIIKHGMTAYLTNEWDIYWWSYLETEFGFEPASTSWNDSGEMKAKGFQTKCKYKRNILGCKKQNYFQLYSWFVYVCNKSFHFITWCLRTLQNQIPDLLLASFARPHISLQPVSNEGDGEDRNYAQHIRHQEIHAETSETQIPVTSRNWRGERCNIVLHSNGMKFERTVYNRRKTDDHYSVFGKFVAQELRSLHSEMNRRLLKRRIQKAVLEVSELDCNKQGPH